LTEARQRLNRLLVFFLLFVVVGGLVVGLVVVRTKEIESHGQTK
jgi:hypothetical protein